MRIPVQIDSAGRAVLGMLHVPARRADGSPLVLMCYGLNGDRVDNHRLSLLFSHKANEAGIAVARFDYSGCGLSSGEFHEVSVASKAADVSAVMDFIRGCEEERAFKLFLLGYSDGIRVVHRILGARRDVAAVGFWNPIIRSMTATFRPGRKSRMVLEPTTRKMVLPLFGLTMSMDYLREANADLDVAQVLAHRLPSLFVFGTGDAHTLAFQSELKALARERSDFDLVEVAGANHLFNRLEWSEALVQTTVDWVLKHSS